MKTVFAHQWFRARPKVPVASHDRRLGQAVRTVASAVLVVLVATAAHGVQVIHVPGDVATLQTALNTISHGGIIELSPGTYVAPSGGFLVSNGARHFTVRGAGTTPVTLDGQSVRAVFRLVDSTTAIGTFVAFENLRFANGLSTTNGTGGGVTVTRANATFVGCVFENDVSNASTTGGGGTFVWGGSTVHFIDCEWLGNTAKNEGGGLRVDASTAVLTSCVFSANRTNLPNHRSSSAGGGIHVTNALVEVADSGFRGNQAGYVGGGLYALGSWVDPPGTNSATVIISNSSFTDNVANPDPSVTPPAATEGGAVHAEDATGIEIFHSRFDRNSAGNGGGVNLYRAEVDVFDSVFRGNRATQTGAGTGFGGAIAAISNDTVADGATNRRSAVLVVERSLLQGRFETVETGGQIGGCLFVTGDGNRRFGQGGVTPTASSAATRATATVTDSALVDCDVLEASGIGGTGVGGGIEIGLATLTIQGSILAKCDAIGTNTSAGAARATFDSITSVSDSTLAANSAASFGGAIVIDGSQLDMDASRVIENQTGVGGVGAALFSAGYAPEFFDATGVISNSTISNTSSHGILLFESDSMTGPINDLRYDGNTIFDASQGSSIYLSGLAGAQTVAGLNGLFIIRSGGTPSTDKSTVNNIDPAAAPIVGDVVAVPPTVLLDGAVDDPAGPTASYVAYGWSGASATLNSSPVAGFAGLDSAGVGTHLLSVGGNSSSATVSTAPTPALSWTASPASISSGESSTLQWATLGGTFVDVSADHRVVLPSTASGSVVVSPTVTTTYRAVLITQQGGAVATATVYVDDPGIFSDDFESGSTSQWSSTVGN